MGNSGHYSVGCKPFLVSLQIGAEAELPSHLNYASVKVVANRIYNDYGCRFTFRQADGKVIVKRLS